MRRPRAGAGVVPPSRGYSISIASSVVSGPIVYFGPEVSAFRSFVGGLG